MAKNGHGGKRAGAGRPPLLPAEAKPERMKGAAGDITLSPARLLSPGQKWAFAELALRHAEQMLAIMVDIAVNGTSEAVRLAAADKVIDRAMGKAPAHIDITAMRHTDIAKFRKALEAEGVRHTSYFDSTLTCCSTTTGSVKANVEPWPGCDSTQILPPCISMMRFDMASPKPVPPFLRVIALSAC